MTVKTFKFIDVSLINILLLSLNS